MDPGRGRRPQPLRLVGSQVVLSLQLPFAVIPLILITGDRRVMGELVNAPAQRILYWVIAAVLVALNGILLVMLALQGFMTGRGAERYRRAGAGPRPSAQGAESAGP